MSHLDNRPTNFLRCPVSLEKIKRIIRSEVAKFRIRV
jgi:hypothetical protein